jgi:NAD(P)-dependent dehydrogenase (short-subunit alcohol dehydrogenase family)
MSFEGKTVLITGGASGIGYEIADKYVKSGAMAIIVDINRQQGEASAKRLGNSVFIEADVSNKASIIDMAERAIAQTGSIDILVNNAGVARHKDALDIDQDNWEFCVNLMLSGVFYCSQAVGKHMVERGTGNIINIASMNGLITLPGRLAYSCCKSAVLSMTRILAAEWAPHRIRVNAVSPGVTMTKLMEDTIASGMANEELYVSRIPLGRLAVPQEIADACLFMTSEQAAYITGHNLVVDGGWSSYNWVDIQRQSSL